MADRPTARDDDRLPWLEPVGEGQRTRARKPVSRTALIGLLVAFFGIGLALAFSLGYRFAKPAADAPAPTTAQPVARQPEPAASVAIPLSPPAAAPLIEPVGPQPLIEPPVAEAPTAKAVTAKPAIKKARTAKAKAKKRPTKRRPILRPFDLTPRPPPPAARWRPPSIPPQSGRVIQLGAYSTTRQAESAWRSIAWRYPYLRTRQKVVVPTQKVGGWTYYRLRLSTETQAQSLVLCQHLQAKGQSCIVIY